MGGTSPLQRMLDAEKAMRPPRAAEPDMTPTWKAEGLSWRDWATTLDEIVEQVVPNVGSRRGG